jgi:flagellar protein FlaG
MKISPPDGSTPAGLVAAEGASPSPPPPAAEEAQSDSSPPTSRSEIARLVEQANRQMASVTPALEFRIDPDTERVVIRLVDRQDQQVLRQVPAPEMLAIARALDRMQTLLLRTRA